MKPEFTMSADVRALNPGLSLESSIKTVPASKFHNTRTEFKGMVFASGHEAAGVSSLVLQEEAKLIFGVRLQVRFPLAGGLVYVADATYADAALQFHVVDFKGLQTREFKMKAKLFREKYGKEIELL